MSTSKPHIYLISDSTGETVSIVARSVLARFNNIKFKESKWALIRTEKQIDNIIEKIRENPGLVLYTMINKNLEKYLKVKCEKIGVGLTPILDSTIQAIKKEYNYKKILDENSISWIANNHHEDFKNFGYSKEI